MKRSTNYAGVFFPYLIMAVPYFSGTIDFDDAEKKRISAEKSSELKRNQIADEKNKNNVVRRVKKTDAPKKGFGTISA